MSISDNYEYVQCLLCGSKNFSIKLKYRTNICTCGNCGLVYTNPRIKPSINEEKIIAHEDFDIKRYNLIKEIEIPRFNKILDDIERIIPHGKILDVGCGNGNFLECASKRGWDTFGVDLNPASFEPCSKYGKIFIGTISNAKFPDNFFDVIFSSSMFCYLLDPLSFLKEAKRVLKKNGLILITGIPNVKSLDAKMYFPSFIKPYPPDQVSYYFDKVHIIRLIKLSALNKLKIKSMGFGISLRFKKNQITLDDNSEGERTSSLTSINVEDYKTFTQNKTIQFVKPVINFILNLFNLGYHFNVYLTKL